MLMTNDSGTSLCLPMNINSLNHLLRMLATDPSQHLQQLDSIEPAIISTQTSAPVRKNTQTSHMESKEGKKDAKNLGNPTNC